MNIPTRLTPLMMSQIIPFICYGQATDLTLQGMWNIS